MLGDHNKPVSIRNAWDDNNIANHPTRRLIQQERQRYVEKIDLIGVDPYKIPKRDLSADKNFYPALNSPLCMLGVTSPHHGFPFLEWLPLPWDDSPRSLS